MKKLTLSALWRSGGKRIKMQYFVFLFNPGIAKLLLILRFLDFAIEAAIEFWRPIPKFRNPEMVCLTKH